MCENGPKLLFYNGMANEAGFYSVMDLSNNQDQAIDCNPGYSDDYVQAPVQSDSDLSPCNIVNQHSPCSSFCSSSPSSEYSPLYETPNGQDLSGLKYQNITEEDQCYSTTSELPSPPIYFAPRLPHQAYNITHYNTTGNVEADSNNIGDNNDASISPSPAVDYVSLHGFPEITRNSQGRFQCSLCGRNYTHGKHLKRHLMIHTGERPYKCSFCNAKFTRPDIRKRHSFKCKMKIGLPLIMPWTTENNLSLDLGSAPDGNVRLDSDKDQHFNSNSSTPDQILPTGPRFEMTVCDESEVQSTRRFPSLPFNQHMESYAHPQWNYDKTIKGEEERDTSNWNQYPDHAPTLTSSTSLSSLASSASLTSLPSTTSTVYFYDPTNYIIHGQANIPTVNDQEAFEKNENRQINLDYLAATNNHVDNFTYRSPCSNTVILSSHCY